MIFIGVHLRAETVIAACPVLVRLVIVNFQAVLTLPLTEELFDRFDLAEILRRIVVNGQIQESFRRLEHCGQVRMAVKEEAVRDQPQASMGPMPAC